MLDIKGEQKMKVLTKLVSIENESFVLIQDTKDDGQVYFGTIPYSELDEKGCMKRALNGFEMCISFNNISEALDRRYDEIKTRGMNLEQMQAYYLAKMWKGLAEAH